MKNTKFKSIVVNYINGNISDFRKSIKALNKSDLLKFCCFCFTHYDNELDIFTIEKFYNS